MDEKAALLPNQGGSSGAPPPYSSSQYGGQYSPPQAPPYPSPQAPPAPYPSPQAPQYPSTTPYPSSAPSYPNPTPGYPGTTAAGYQPPPTQYGGGAGYQQFQVPPPPQVHTVPMPPQVPMPQPGATIVQPNVLKEDYYLMSMILSLVWCLICAPYLLFCSIPAMCFAQNAKDAARDGDIASARKSAQNALYCNIASIVCAVIAYISLVVFIPVAVVAANVAVRS